MSVYRTIGPLVVVDYQTVVGVLTFSVGCPNSAI